MNRVLVYVEEAENAIESGLVAFIGEINSALDSLLLALLISLERVTIL
jgi:hypothetical protein